MKHKKQIATGALAISLLIGGSSIFAATPEDLGIKSVQPVYQKQNKDKDKIKVKRQRSTVGIISAMSNTGFILDVKNLKTKETSSVDVKTNKTTTYNKNGINTSVSDLSVGQKVIVLGELDKTTETITAKTVKIVTKVIGIRKNKKVGN
jgi:hypothetical protein